MLSRIKPRGKRAERWAAWQRQERTACVERANGRCEAFKVDMRCTKSAQDWHHAFGRKHLIAEPFASWRVFTLMLCRDCHHWVHLDAEITKEARHSAVERLAQFIDVPNVRTVDPLAMARSFVDEAARIGWNPQMGSDA